MKVFISQPMNGLTDAEIVAIREKIFGDYQVECPDAELQDAYSDVKSKMGEYYTYEHPNIAMLAESLFSLANSDIVLMAPEWEKHRGCRVEQKVAQYYDIPIKYVR